MPNRNGTLGPTEWEVRTMSHTCARCFRMLIDKLGVQNVNPSSIRTATKTQHTLIMSGFCEREDLCDGCYEVVKKAPSKFVRFGEPCPYEEA